MSAWTAIQKIVRVMQMLTELTKGKKRVNKCVKVSSMHRISSSESLLIRVCAPSNYERDERRLSSSVQGFKIASDNIKEPD